jgi:hypothetical protein
MISLQCDRNQAAPSLPNASHFRASFQIFFRQIDSSVTHTFALSGLPVYLIAMHFGFYAWGLIEKLTHFPQHLVEFRCLHLPPSAGKHLGYCTRACLDWKRQVGVAALPGSKINQETP